MLHEIVTRTGAAQALLDEQEQTFDQLRDLERTAPDQLAALRPVIDALRTRQAAAAALAARLVADYAASATASIGGNSPEAEKAIASAAAETDRGLGLVTAGKSHEAVVALRHAQDGVAGATLLLDAVEKLGGEARRGRGPAAGRARRGGRGHGHRTDAVSAGGRRTVVRRAPGAAGPDCPVSRTPGGRAPPRRGPARRRGDATRPVGRARACDGRQPGGGRDRRGGPGGGGAARAEAPARRECGRHGARPRRAGGRLHHDATARRGPRPHGRAPRRRRPGSGTRSGSRGATPTARSPRRSRPRSSPTRRTTGPRASSTHGTPAAARSPARTRPATRPAPTSPARSWAGSSAACCRAAAAGAAGAGRRGAARWAAAGGGGRRRLRPAGTVRRRRRSAAAGGGGGGGRVRGGRW